MVNSMDSNAGMDSINVDEDIGELEEDVVVFYLVGLEELDRVIREWEKKFF